MEGLRTFARGLLLASCIVMLTVGCDASSQGTGGRPDAAPSSGGQGSGGKSGSGSGGMGVGGTVGGNTGAGGDVAGAGGTQAGVGGSAGADAGLVVGATGGRGPIDGGGAAGVGGRAQTGGRAGTGGASGLAGMVGSGGAGLGGQMAAGGRTGAGGAASGGAIGAGGASGGGGSTGPCTPAWEEPPSNVAAWINESWNDQLGSNVKNRKAWLIDSAIMGKGQINLCVRWGATSAPTTAVKSGMATAVEKWVNDWFSHLADYGCFPYANITTKVTGWAVKPGNTSWVSDLDSSIKVYTETDSEGEPKCPDSCSFFTNWNHTFPNCPGGEAFHTDYWLWLDDSIGGGAAAVGGDWGLRMPVSNFVASMGKSNMVIEHEMGHGFGFQDYYDWTGSTPSGGSLMIVGSTNSQVPTVADQWLLRRTWKEMKTLRGW
jgi:hypothetical protein